MGMFDNLLPDFSNPNSMAVFGGIGNMLMQGGEPRHISGMGAGNALAMLLGSGMAGASAGAQGAQEFQKEKLANTQAAALNPLDIQAKQIGNQTAQLGLDRQQVMQPYMLNMMKSIYGGNGAAPGAMGTPSAGGTAPPMGGADAQFAQAYQLAMASGAQSGDFSKAAAVLQSWAEHNPQLAGQIKNEQERQSIVSLPGGRQVPGSNILPTYGSPIPSMPSAPMQQTGGSIPMPPAPANQAMGTGKIPPISASQLFPQGAPPQASVDPNDPVAVAGATEAAKQAAEIAGAAPKAEATETGKNVAESDRAVASIIGRLPNAFSIVDKMSELAPKVPYGPLVEKQRDVLNALKQPGGAAYDQFHKYNENLFTQELPAIVQNSGGRIDIPLVKSIQAASQVPLDAQPASKTQLLSNTKDLLQKVRDNALSTYKAQTGKDFDLGRAFSTKEQVVDAVKSGVITKAQGVQILQNNHGMK